MSLNNPVNRLRACSIEIFWSTGQGIQLCELKLTFLGLVTQLLNVLWRKYIFVKTNSNNSFFVYRMLYHCQVFFINWSRMGIFLHHMKLMLTMALAESVPGVTETLFRLDHLCLQEHNKYCKVKALISSITGHLVMFILCIIFYIKICRIKCNCEIQYFRPPLFHIRELGYRITALVYGPA